jgi:iron complex transport system permease protein
MRRHLVIRSPGFSVRLPAFSVRLPLRPTAVLATLLALTVVAVCLATSFGEYSLPVPEVLRTIAGQGTAIDNLVIVQFRLPRIVECVLIGAALGLSGGIFQTLTRNPLAAPDVIGVNEGAAVVAVWLLLAGAPAALVPVGAFAGALGAVGLVALLGVRRQLSMYRLILVGIGINTLAAAVIAYLLTRASPANFDRLQVAQQWLFGSVAGATWYNVGVVALALVVITPLVFACGRQLNTLQLGDDLGVGLGVPIVRVQLVTAGLGALLAAVVVSVAGPIGFVAFVSPHIARRLTRTASVASLPAAMAVGGLLLLVSDYTAERILEPTELPVGITTTVIGAPYLLFLLLRGEQRSGIA